MSFSNGMDTERVGYPMIMPSDVQKLSQNKIQNIILMKAQEKSISSIAKELHIAKLTVCNAVKYFDSEIRTEMFAIAESYKEQYKISKERKLRVYMDLLDKAYSELENRKIDFTSLTIDELLKAIENYENIVKSSTRNCKIDTNVIIIDESGNDFLMEKQDRKILHFEL